MVFTPKDGQSLNPKDCPHSTFTTTGITERQISLHTTYPASFHKNPFGSTFLSSLDESQCQAWGPYSQLDVTPFKARANSPFRKHRAGDWKEGFWKKPMSDNCENQESRFPRTHIKKLGRHGSCLWSWRLGNRDRDSPGQAGQLRLSQISELLVRWDLASIKWREVEEDTIEFTHTHTHEHLIPIVWLPHFKTAMQSPRYKQCMF